MDIAVGGLTSLVNLKWFVLQKQTNVQTNLDQVNKAFAVDMSSMIDTEVIESFKCGLEKMNLTW